MGKSGAGEVHACHTVWDMKECFKVTVLRWIDEILHLLGGWSPRQWDKPPTKCAAFVHPVRRAFVKHLGGKRFRDAECFVKKAGAGARHADKKALRSDLTSGPFNILAQ